MFEIYFKFDKKKVKGVCEKKFLLFPVKFYVSLPHLTSEFNQLFNHLLVNRQEDI